MGGAGGDVREASGWGGACHNSSSVAFFLQGASCFSFFFLFWFLVFGDHLKNTPYMFSKFTSGTGRTDLGGNLKGSGQWSLLDKRLQLCTETTVPSCGSLSWGGPRPQLELKIIKVVCNVNSSSERCLSFPPRLPALAASRPLSQPQPVSPPGLAPCGLHSSLLGFLPVYCSMFRSTPGLSPKIAPPKFLQASSKPPGDTVTPE